jgi:sugar phosphate isomerase/epimerase
MKEISYQSNVTHLGREKLMNRRAFVYQAVGLITALHLADSSANAAGAVSPIQRVQGFKWKLSCNLFSFNQPLTQGEMTLEAVMEYCASLGFEAVDPTAYYFPGYPELPPPGYLQRIKKLAFLQGLDISGTGIRNDFTLSEEGQRRQNLDLVRKWCGAAALLGAPVLRLFSGKGVPDGIQRETVRNWLVSSLQKSCGFAEEQGILIGLQNHADFIQTAAQLLEVVEEVNSEWLGVNLDIGSFNSADPYAEIAQCAPYEVTWQIKENIKPNGRETKTDLKKIVQILKDAGYRGYLPLETLGEGDPKEKVRKFLEEVRTALG